MQGRHKFGTQFLWLQYTTGVKVAKKKTFIAAEIQATYKSFLFQIVGPWDRTLSQKVLQQWLFPGRKK